MKNKYLEDWIQGIGLLGVMGSLIFVGLQVKQADEVAVMDVLDGTAERGHELSALIADNADVWYRACLGEELTPPERIIAANIYWSYLQSSWNNWVRIRETGLGSTSPDFLTNAYAANLHRYPGFREIALSYRDWSEIGRVFDGKDVEVYRAAVFARLEELQELEPEPDADVTWCGAQ
jgi:hypothetical protein